MKFPSWLLALSLLDCVLVTSLPSITQVPLAIPEIKSNGQDYPIIPEETVEYFDHLRRRYGIKGLSIAVVAAPSYTRGEGWLNQTISLGKADIRDNKVTDEVSRFHTYIGRHQLIDRPFLRSLPIQSFLPRSLLRF